VQPTLGQLAHLDCGSRHNGRLAEVANLPMPKKTTRKEPASPVADFEHSLEQLEHLVERMERGDLTLEDALAAYEQGVGLYRRCQEALEQAELRVRLLSDPEHPERAEAFPALETDAPDA